MAKAKVTDNTKNIKNNIKVNSSLFLRIMTDEIVDISTPKTPKDTGRMRFDILKQVLGFKGKIIWGKNYAGYQETKQFKHYTTPGTGPHFAENAVKEGVSKTSTVAKRAFK